MIPFPIENTAGACKVSAVMARNSASVLIIVTGLQAKEEFETTKQSGSEKIAEKLTAADDGSYRELVFPFVKGQASGELKFSASSKSCIIDVQIPWGDGSYVIQ